MGVGGNIRRLRELKNISQAELAEALGVSKETVSRWENGRIAIRRRHIDKMCALYGVRPDDITSESHGLASGTITIRDSPTMPRSDGIPVYKIVNGPTGMSLKETLLAHAPSSVESRHPDSVFLVVPNTEICKVCPPGDIVMVDPYLKPWNGCIVAAVIDRATILIRRYASGSSMIMLSTHSYVDSAPDVVLDQRRIRILGTVVWHQAQRDAKST